MATHVYSTDVNTTDSVFKNWNGYDINLRTNKEFYYEDFRIR
jgi:hypothetical protein